MAPTHGKAVLMPRSRKTFPATRVNGAMLLNKIVPTSIFFSLVYSLIFDKYDAFQSTLSYDVHKFNTDNKYVDVNVF